uniref:Uncharacterized protein n=1 Tax=Canis lupus familiaris TaxID=9615 RepID=A0A8I3PWI1_CANLF
QKFYTVGGMKKGVAGMLTRLPYQKRHIGNLDNLKVNSRSVTDSMTFGTKSYNQNFIIFLNKIQTTIIGFFFGEGRHFLFYFFAIFDQRDPDILPDARIWLFGFNLYFSQHSSLCTGSISKRIGFQDCAQMGFLVLFIMPRLISSVTMKIPGNMTLAQPASTMAYSIQPYDSSIL